MPVAWGGAGNFYGAGGLVTRKTRTLCMRCNHLRGSCGHCIGALACVLAVSETEGIKPNLVMRRWKFSQHRPALGKRGMRRWIREAGLAPLHNATTSEALK